MRKTNGRSEQQGAGAEPPLCNRRAALRAERGLSRQHLAVALGINYQTVGYRERGEYNPSLGLAFRIAETFNLPIETICARKPFAPMSTALYSRPAAWLLSLSGGER